MFAQTIERRLHQARAKKMRLLRPMTRARHIFALMATYGLRQVRDRHRIARRVLKYRQQWLHMLEQLCMHQLWSPVTDIRFVPQDRYEEPRFDFAFGLCTRCLPTCVKWSRLRSRRYRRKIKADIIPCRKTNICPACYAAVAEQQYRHFKQVLNLLQKKQAVRLTVRTETVFVPASTAYDRDFQQQELLIANIHILRDAMAARRVVNGSALHKRIQRRTLGAFWRALAIPRETGWDVVTRWAFLTEVDAALPDTVFDSAVTVEDQSVLLPQRQSWALQHTATDLDEQVATALLTFAKYPREWLTGDVDLVAAWLHAAARTRLVSGYGLLTQAGSSLLSEFKKTDKARAYRKKAPRAEEAAAQE
jgi:hypothetical protein